MKGGHVLLLLAILSLALLAACGQKKESMEKVAEAAMPAINETVPEKVVEAAAEVKPAAANISTPVKEVVAEAQPEVQLLDPSKCASISFLAERTKCYVDAAVSNKDIAICKNLDRPEMVEGCYANVTRVKPDLSICDIIKRDEFKDKCYINAAGGAQNVSICAIIENSAAKDECYTSVAISSDNSGLCEKLFNKYPCYIAFAMNKKDVSYCNSILNTANRELCYLNTTQVNLDVENCKLITSSISMLDDCFVIVSIGKKDLASCIAVESKSKKNFCYYNITGKNLTVS